jgi:hypothetical protein
MAGDQSNLESLITKVQIPTVVVVVVVVVVNPAYPRAM